MGTNTNKAQYDGLANQYEWFAKNDPLKHGSQYPSALKALGNTEGKTVLDIGCGGGIFARELVLRGASVVGYDESAAQVRKANELGLKNAEFVVATPETFTSTKRFDAAIALLVLMYARDEEQMQAFFTSTYSLLVQGSKFVAVVFNPEFQRYGEIVCGRRFTKLTGDAVRAEFMAGDTGENMVVVLHQNPSVRQYEDHAKRAGFSSVRWDTPVHLVPPRFEGKMDESYWAGFEEDCPYKVLTAVRT